MKIDIYNNEEETQMKPFEAKEGMNIGIPTLSTGQKSTVGNWVKLASVVFGEDSKQVEFLRSKATKENGFDEPIIADERQLLFALMNMDAHYCEIANERIQKALAEIDNVIGGKEDV